MRIAMTGLILVLTAAAPSVHAADTVAGLIAQADKLDLSGDLQGAYDLTKKALVLAQAGHDPVALGDALASVCEQGTGMYDPGADVYCQQAYDQRLKTLGKDDFKTYISEAELANLYLDSDAPKAVAMTQDAAGNMERLARTPDDWAQTATAYGMLALALKYQGKFLDARAPFEKSIVIMRRPDVAPNVALASSLTDYADMDITLGDFDKAFDLASQALEVRAKLQAPDHPDVADTLGVAGDALRRMGRYDEAETYFQRALKISEATQPQVPVILGRGYQNLGQIYMNTGRYAEAQTLQAKAVAMFAPLGDKGQMLLSGAYYDLSNSYASQGETRLALEAANNALDTILKQKDRTFDRSLTYIAWIANLKFKSGDYDGGKALVDEVLATRLTASPTSSRTADALLLRATMLHDKGDYAGARADLEQARTILKPLSPYSSAAIRVDSLLAATLLAQGDMTSDPSAYALADKAVQAQAHVLTTMARLQGATGGLQTPADRREIFDTLLDAAWVSTH